MTFLPPLNQIAFSVIDLRRTEQWFREGFQLLPAGGARALMRGPLPARIQGLPGAASTCWWLVGRNPWFQFELFQFEKPMARLVPEDQQASDIGYRRVGLWVADFDATLARLAALGSAPLSPPMGPGGDRRACVRNPDGVFVEIMEKDPLPAMAAAGRQDCPAAIRSITLSVPDLERSAAFFRELLGTDCLNWRLHAPEHEALWGLAGATLNSALFQAGDVLVELVQYLDPVGKPWPEGYRICDQGILNMAFGARNKRDHRAAYRRALAAGARPNCAPIDLFVAGVVYVNDPQGFSVEILWMGNDFANRKFGFEPLLLDRRPPPDNRRLEAAVTIAAPIKEVWSIIADHEGMADWCGFRPVRLLRPGGADRNGTGAEREMSGPGGAIVEQVVSFDPPYGYRYRVISGSPVICHQGEVALSSRGGGTDVTWRIRFRAKHALIGPLLQIVMRKMLGRMLKKRLPAALSRKVGV